MQYNKKDIVQYLKLDKHEDDIIFMTEKDDNIEVNYFDNGYGFGSSLCTMYINIQLFQNYLRKEKINKIKDAIQERRYKTIS